MRAPAPTGLENTFPGFTEHTFDFFQELAGNNNKMWFERNRERYETHVRGVFQSLLAALQPTLLKLNPCFEVAGKVNRNFSRINRDIRFSKDKSPYKSNYYLYIFDSRRDRQTDGRLYVGLNAECVTVGFATYASWKPKTASALETVFRKRLVSNRGALDNLVDRIVRGGRYETYWHRNEKNEWALHPGLPRCDHDWQTVQAWVVRKVFPAETRAIAKPDFAERIKRIFLQLYPLYIFTSLESSRWQAELRKYLK